MSTPPEPPSGINVVTSEPEGVTYGPDMFYADLSAPTPGTELNQPMPRAWSQGGVIESVKTAVVNGVTEALRGTGMQAQNDENAKFSISIEYPTKMTDYPGIWIQFTIESMSRGGLGMESWTQVNGNWGAIQTWTFNGRITLTIAALSSKDRDRLADAVIAQLAFSRAPDQVIRQSSNTNQFRGLITALNNNPYVAMTLGTDVINSGGQTVTTGVPWAPNLLLYEDAYSLTCVGQFNIRFAHDGTYSLNAINVDPTISAGGQVYNPIQWLGVQPST
jgi:hypothetical protein